MEILEHYLSLLTKAIFIENILLAYFLGMCSFLGVSKKVDASIGLGFAVIFVSTITVPVNWIIKKYLLNQGALSWIPIAGLEDVNLLFLRFSRPFLPPFFRLIAPARWAKQRITKNPSLKFKDKSKI